MAKRKALAAAMLIAVLAGCKPVATVDTANDGSAAAPASPLRPPSPDNATAAGIWSLVAGTQSIGLAFASTGSRRIIQLHCAAGSTRLLVNLPTIRPIGSEERLSFGGGGEVVALVADVGGDSLRGGVSGSGSVPASIEAMLRAGPGASYGASAIGPLPPVAPEDARRFAAACRAKSPPPALPPNSPCRDQDGKPIAGPPLRAIGTEPFWGADIDGRCVTYSTPETQAGVRIWTRFTAAGGASTYVGALDGQPFRMDVRPQAACSDGMSDRRYPFQVTLRIGADLRRGCAAPR